MTDQATQDAPTDAQPRPAVAGQVERSVSRQLGGLPLPELLSVGTNGARNVSFDPLRVLAWVQHATTSMRAIHGGFAANDDTREARRPRSGSHGQPGARLPARPARAAPRRDHHGLRHRRACHARVAPAAIQAGRLLPRTGRRPAVAPSGLRTSPMARAAGCGDCWPGQPVDYTTSDRSRPVDLRPPPAGARRTASRPCRAGRRQPARPARGRGTAPDAGPVEVGAHRGQMPARSRRAALQHRAVDRRTRGRRCRPRRCRNAWRVRTSTAALRECRPRTARRASRAWRRSTAAMPPALRAAARDHDSGDRCFAQTTATDSCMCAAPLTTHGLPRAARPAGYRADRTRPSGPGRRHASRAPPWLRELRRAARRPREPRTPCLA
jgi:hypothetical protein